MSGNGRYLTIYGFLWYNITRVNYLEEGDLMDGYVDIKGFEGYKINKDGVVMSYKRVFPREIKHHVKGNGYVEVTLSDKKGSYKQVGLHRLLAEAFIPKPDNAEIVNHKDGNTLNYSLDNLEWITQSENKLHAIYTLKKKTHKQKTIIVDGVEFESYKKCAEHFGINYHNLADQLRKGIIPRALRGKTIVVK